MNKPTFKEQSEKIIQAYLKCEIDPFLPCACFIGNLLNNQENWLLGRTSEFEIDFERPYYDYAVRCVKEESRGLYTLKEVYSMEKNFLRIATRGSFKRRVNNETLLFEAMISTLEMLKQIHISKGEEIEEEITLQKRELV